MPHISSRGNGKDEANFMKKSAVPEGRTPDFVAVRFERLLVLADDLRGEFAQILQPLAKVHVP